MSKISVFMYMFQNNDYDYLSLENVILKYYRKKMKDINILCKNITTKEKNIN